MAFPELPNFPGISFIRHEGCPYNDTIPRNPLREEVLIKEGRFEERRYFYVKSFTENGIDKLSITITNGVTGFLGIGGVLDAVLGVSVVFFDENFSSIFRIDCFENVTRPAIARVYDVDRSLYDVARHMQISWYKGENIDRVQVYVTASGTF